MVLFYWVARHTAQHRHTSGTIHMWHTQSLNGEKGKMILPRVWLWHFVESISMIVMSVGSTSPQRNIKGALVLCGFGAGMLTFALLLPIYLWNRIRKHKSSTTHSCGSGYSICWTSCPVVAFPSSCLMQMVELAWNLASVWVTVSPEGKTTTVPCYMSVCNIIIYYHLFAVNTWYPCGPTYFGQFGNNSRIDYICLPQSKKTSVQACTVPHSAGDGLQCISARVMFISASQGLEIIFFIFFHFFHFDHHFFGLKIIIPFYPR